VLVLFTIEEEVHQDKATICDTTNSLSPTQPFQKSYMIARNRATTRD
jgi:hypothetical protein